MRQLKDLKLLDAKMVLKVFIVVFMLIEMEKLKEQHIDEICELSKTMSSAKFNINMDLNDLSDLNNASSLLKWHEKYYFYNIYYIL
jgi:hypothetical protein